MLIGIQDGPGFGDTFIGFGQMMVGNNQINSHTHGGLGRLKGSNSRIHADDQPDARSRRPLDDVIFHPVAFFNSMGNMEISHSPAQLYGGFQDHHGSSAINVIVAVNQDLLVVDNGSAQ